MPIQQYVESGYIRQELRGIIGDSNPLCRYQDFKTTMYNIFNQGVWDGFRYGNMRIPVSLDIALTLKTDKQIDGLEDKVMDASKKIADFGFKLGSDLVKDFVSDKITKSEIEKLLTIVNRDFLNYIGATPDFMVKCIRQNILKASKINSKWCYMRPPIFPFYVEMA